MPKRTKNPKQLKAHAGTLRYYRRIKCRWSVGFVAEKIGVTPGAVYKWENDESEPAEKNLIALAELYKVKPEALCEDFAFKFKEHANDGLMRLFDQCVEHDDAKQRRIAIQIYRVFFPEGLGDIEQTDEPEKAAYDPLKDLVDD